MKTVREILNKYFGKDYLRDIHTGDSIDMSSEIDQALLEIKEVIVPEEKKLKFNSTVEENQRIGFNQCRAELLRRLEAGK